MRTTSCKFLLQQQIARNGEPNDDLTQTRDVVQCFSETLAENENIGFPKFRRRHQAVFASPRPTSTKTGRVSVLVFVIVPAFFTARFQFTL